GDEGAGGEVGGAVEGHVLEVVGDAALAISLVERAGVHVDPHDGAAGRDGVALDDVAEAVVELAGGEGGVGGEGLREGGGQGEERDEGGEGAGGHGGA